MKHRYSVMEPTAEMQLWVGDEDPRLAPVAWGSYTELGPFKPKARRRGAYYAKRVEHAAKHFPRPQRGSLAKWAHSKAREIGEFWVGAFQPIREAF